MFCGSVCYADCMSAVTSHSDWCDVGEAVFHPVSTDWFSGGYYLHPRLPHVFEDVYFRSEKEDILVLLSGSVYNRAGLAASVGITTKIHDPELIAILFLAGWSRNLCKTSTAISPFSYSDRPSARLICSGITSGYRPLAWIRQR